MINKVFHQFIIFFKFKIEFQNASFFVHTKKIYTWSVRNITANKHSMPLI